MKGIQLVLDLPINGLYIQTGQRVKILKPHKDADKTGRVNMRFQFKSGTLYLVNLRGKTITCQRTELETI